MAMLNSCIAFFDVFQLVKSHLDEGLSLSFVGSLCLVYWTLPTRTIYLTIFSSQINKWVHACMGFSKHMVTVTCIVVAHVQQLCKWCRKIAFVECILLQATQVHAMILQNMATSVMDIFVATTVKLSRTPVVMVWARLACMAGDLP